MRAAGRRRRRGRRPLLFLSRSQRCERSPLHRVDGSATWCQGATSVTAAIHGPRATTARGECPTTATVGAEWAPAGGAPADEHRAFERLIEGAVTGALRGSLLPRTAVSAVVAVGHDDGATLAAAVNAVSAAMVDAALPLRHTLCAAAVAVDSGGRPAADPTAAEEAAAASVATFVFAAFAPEPGAPPALDGDTVVACHVRGRVSDEALLAAEALARGAAARVAVFQKAGLVKSLAAAAGEGVTAGAVS